MRVGHAHSALGGRPSSQAVTWTLVGMALLAGCAKRIAPEDLLAQIETEAAPIIVDVRSEREFTQARVPGAIHIPFWALATRLDRLPEDSGARPVVVYCEHGPRAGIARAQLWLAGRRPVLYLQGHMSGWRRRGLPVTRGAPEP